MGDTVARYVEQHEPTSPPQCGREALKAMWCDNLVVAKIRPLEGARPNAADRKDAVKRVLAGHVLGRVPEE